MKAEKPAGTQRTAVIVTFCNPCQGDKNHKTLFKKIGPKDPFDGSSNEYSVIQCLGCDNVSFLHISIPKKKSEKPTYYNYPQSSPYFDGLYDFLSDEHQNDLPAVIYNLYDEVISTFHADATVLAGIGLRTLIEAICIDQNIQGSNLHQKIQGLHKAGYISATELPIVDKLRVIGNVSAHEIKSLSINSLEYALGIINHVLRSIYVLPKLNKRLKI